MLMCSEHLHSVQVSQQLRGLGVKNGDNGENDLLHIRYVF
jgi:hypothetical protein